MTALSLLALLLAGCAEIPAMLPLWVSSDDRAEVYEPIPPPSDDAAPDQAPTTPPVPVSPGPTVEGLCDLSAGVVVGDRWLLGVDDEANLLHTFDLDHQGAHSLPHELGETLSALGDEEADLEGAALIGDRLWLVASHDSGKGTQRKAARQRLVAYDVEPTDFGVRLSPVGSSDQLIEAGQYTRALMGIVSNTVGKTSKAPGGLSIEGLAAGPDGSLLVGFRTPIHGDKALVIRLDDPKGLLEGGEPALTGPRWLDLGGRGIRSMEALPDGGWLLVAGPPGKGDDFALFTWDGFDDGSAPVQLDLDVGDLRPEGLTRRGDTWWLLSDDGGLDIDGGDCKDLPREQQRARTATFTR